jgi:hypothetical protein
MTDQVWEDIFLNTGSISFRDAHVFGIAAAWMWDAPISRLSWGVEVQSAKWFGRQDNWEANIATILRYSPVRQVGPVRSVAFGIGPSLASQPPSEELARNGTARAELIYWMGELEFGRPDSTTRGFARIHHRSNGYGLLGPQTGSNSLVLGVRRDF